eukprot:6194875-Pleurochrysis_carterae.AAC.2
MERQGMRIRGRVRAQAARCSTGTPRLELGIGGQRRREAAAEGGCGARATATLVLDEAWPVQARRGGRRPSDAWRRRAAPCCLVATRGRARLRRAPTRGRVGTRVMA